VVAAGDVIEFVAKIAIATVEVDMKEQLGKRDEPDQSHALSKKGE